MIKTVKLTWLTLILIALLGTPRISAQMAATKAYVEDVKEITDIMVYDVTSPVAAARYYAYITLTSYEIMAQEEKQNYSSFSNFFNRPLKAPTDSETQLKNKVDAYRYALLFTGLKLLPSGNKLLARIQKVKQNLSEEELDYIEGIAQSIVAYANQDGFLQLNNLKRYTPKRGEAFWQPTKPAYMAPVEQNWNTISPFFLKSANQFLTKPPIKFDLNPNSEFYKLLSEVKEITDRNDKEFNEIAAFWDCNPYAISQIGHLEFGLKKISPGGHWIGIAGIASIKAKLGIEKTIFTHTLLSLTLHDAFIACWDEKYRSDRVRPETVINRHMDKFWSPLLQTPPFPEYVSGHSVVSTASAKILSQIFGSKFRFRDTTEKEFGLKTRTYQSFEQAAEEACISRLYGGIHYMDAIDEGIWQGEQVADFILDKTKAYFPF
ncbi:MAG: vanadium-dependent haloperoxidase [Flavobacteriaceae bacterium]|nr:vanadium-dependent haloperoxidase [Flavobacteriaceae bacterium]MDG2386735.1 vanadium-dependent haloperoxidase [Flavobacteriaceae bacterium]